jgi:DNA-binding PadR family transcriptional regulator
MGPRERARTESERFLPLRPELLFILLVLSRGVLHGYALLEAVERESQGEARVRTGSLYRFLGRLLDDGLIEETAAPASEASTDERRRYYGITAAGQAVLRAEVARMKRVVSAAEAGRVGRRASRA